LWNSRLDSSCNWSSTY